MRRIALLISSNMFPDAPDARDDIHEFDLQFAALAPPCRSRLLRLEPMIWDEPPGPWTEFDAVVIGTVWDYWDKLDRFLETLDAIEAAGTPLFNPARVVRWNIDKGYLAELAARGAPSIPTLYRDDAAPETIAKAFDELDAETVVIKPRVGAGGHRLVRATRGAPPPSAEALPSGPCLIQPFLPSVTEKGEITFMFYDGVFSHAVRKAPKAGDFRVQSSFGGSEYLYEPTHDEIDSAAQVLAAVGEPLLYARVDMVEGLDGSASVIELEIIEPYHYPEQGPACGAHFAAALDRYLSAPRAPAPRPEPAVAK